MHKSDLVNHIQVHTGLSKAGAERALHITLLTITKTLKRGESVSLVGFGSFTVLKRAARTARNPSTGEAIKVKAKKIVRFTPGKALSDSVE